MRYIQVPETITLEPIRELLSEVEFKAAKSEALSFKAYALRSWLNDARAIDTFEKQVRWAKVVDKFMAAEPGNSIELEDQDFDVLKSLVERPSMMLPGLLTVRLLAYPRAVLEAPTTKPALPVTGVDVASS